MRVTVDTIKASSSKALSTAVRSFDRITMGNVNTPFGVLITAVFLTYEDGSNVLHEDNSKVEYDEN